MNKKSGVTAFLSLCIFLLGFFHPGVTAATVDTTPPTFKALDFSGDVVKTGESITVYVDAEDQLSGIKEATLMLRSPSGLQSEYLWLNQKDSLGRLFGELKIPSEAELGQWEVGYLSIEDNAFNYWKYFHKEGFSYQYDNQGNIQYLETTPIKIKVIDNDSEQIDILTELDKMHNQNYETIASIEEAFILLTNYEEIIVKLPDSEAKVLLELRLQECKAYLVSILQALIKEKVAEKYEFSQLTLGFLVQYAIEEVHAESVEDSDLIVGFLKPILKGYVSGHELHYIIIEKLN